jgi:hypothetical protein
MVGVVRVHRIRGASGAWRSLIRQAVSASVVRRDASGHAAERQTHVVSPAIPHAPGRRGIRIAVGGGPSRHASWAARGGCGIVTRGGIGQGARHGRAGRSFHLFFGPDQSLSIGFSLSPRAGQSRSVGRREVCCVSGSRGTIKRIDIAGCESFATFVTKKPGSTIKALHGESLFFRLGCPRWTLRRRQGAQATAATTNEQSCFLNNNIERT